MFLTKSRSCCRCQATFEGHPVRRYCDDCWGFRSDRAPKGQATPAADINPRPCRHCLKPFANGPKQRRYCDECQSPSGGVRWQPADRSEDGLAKKSRYDRKYYENKTSSERKSIIGRKKMLISLAKRRARERNIEFNISIENVTIPQFCPILGIPLIHGEGHHSDNSPTIDRIKNDKGYIIGNIQIVSYRANRLKSDATPEELRIIANYVEGLKCF